MIPILFTLGLFIKTVHISYTDYRKNDVLTIIMATACAVLLTLYAYLDSNSGDQRQALIVLPVVYLSIIAFTGFKSRLLPVVTESMLLIHGFIGSYFYVQYGLQTGVMASEAYFYGALLFVLYLCLASALIISSLRLNRFFQACCMAMFIVMNIYIGINMILPSVENISHPLWAIVIGFSSASLLANVLYIVYLIPIPGKHQTMTNRLQNIKQHLSDFERNYFDADATKHELLVMASLVGIAFGLEFFTDLETFVIIAIILALVELTRKKLEQLVEFHS